jgi:GrpB-like predicted nucleotidyltransferase (UPF0157 family)
MQIEIHSYNKDWLKLFDLEKVKIQEALIHLDHTIEHIGSTSIKGLATKPIIDIMIGIPDFKKADKSIAPIEKLGYNYISEFENIMPYRMFFTKSQEGIKTHHINLVQKHSEFWNRHLAFRNHLRENSSDKYAYQELKIQLAKQDWESGNEYSGAKTNFIINIESKLDY